MKCEDCQLACYDLLDRSLCAKDEREVLSHIEQCSACRSFLEAEGKRMRTWPRLLGVAARNASLPPDAVERVSHALEISQGKGFRSRLKAWGREHFSKKSGPWFALAASLLGLASLGSAFCLTKGHFLVSLENTCTLTAADDAVPAVRVVKQTDILGLNVPETLPGLLSFESGELVVRLQTGVELTLVGPTRVDVRTGLNVCLDQGQLLASVPHWATGFTVRTHELEIRDLGTVFGVQAKEYASDVFVFKGRVQVNEAAYSESGRDMPGAEMGICKAGEGVRAVQGTMPVKIAADWPEAEKLFGAVKSGRAFRDPHKTFETATRIADLCSERYLPGSSLVAKRTRMGNGIPFQNTAWVRTTASLQQGEAYNMNKASAAAALTAAAVMMGAGTTGATSVPIQIETSPGFSRHWHTVFTNEVGLKWDWCAGATRAELNINGMNGAFTTNFAGVTSNYLWRAFTASLPSVEDVYDLRLTFFSGSDAVAGALTSRLAVVKAAFGKSAVIPATTARGWTTVRDNAVIPYDAGWAAATADAANSRLVIRKVGGASQTNALSDAAGYYGWKLKHGDWGYGAFNLALTFPGAQGEWNATVNYLPNGTLIGVR